MRVPAARGFSDAPAFFSLGLMFFEQDEREIRDYGIFYGG